MKSQFLNRPEVRARIQAGIERARHYQAEGRSKKAIEEAAHWAGRYYPETERGRIKAAVLKALKGQPPASKPTETETKDQPPTPDERLCPDTFFIESGSPEYVFREIRETVAETQGPTARRVYRRLLEIEQQAGHAKGMDFSALKHWTWANPYHPEPAKIPHPEAMAIIHATLEAIQPLAPEGHKIAWINDATPPKPQPAAIHRPTWPPTRINPGFITCLKIPAAVETDPYGFGLIRTETPAELKQFGAKAWIRPTIGGDPFGGYGPLNPRIINQNAPRSKR